MSSKYNDLEPYLASSINKYGADENIQMIQRCEAVVLEKLDYCLCRFSLVNAWIQMKNSIMEEYVPANFESYILACVIRLLTDDDVVKRGTGGNTIEVLIETLRRSHISSRSLMDDFILQYHMTFGNYNTLVEKLISRHFFPHKEQID